MNGLKSFLSLTVVTLMLFSAGMAVGDDETLVEAMAVGPSGSAQPLLKDAHLYFSTTPPIAGDYDSDEVIGGGDFLVWQQHFGPKFDGNDLLVWQSSFDAGGSGVAAAQVPEPSTALLAILAVLSAACGVRRR